MPALPLNFEQQQDANRLKIEFTKWQEKQRERKQPWSQDHASEALEFGQSALSQYLNGKIPLNVDAAAKMANLLGVRVEAFSPAIAREIAVLNGGVTVPQVEPLSNSNLELPQYEAAGGMGNGLVLEDKQPGVIKSWCVDREWLRLNVPHYTAAKNLCIVTGFGPSMRPKYNPGDPLLLDRGVTAVETEGIYFFRVGTHGYIKQLQRIPVEDGLIIRAKSLNKDYDPFDITSKMDFEVFGKVLTVWRSEQV